MEEEEQNNEVIIQEMFVQQAGQADGETLTINLDDASQIILQEPGEDEGSVDRGVQTFQILTQDGIQVGEGMGAEGINEVTQIEVPIEMLQEAVEMLQGQDIQGDAVEAAIARIAARHMEAARAEAVDGEGDIELMEVTQSDIDAANTHILNSELLNADHDKNLPDTSELEALTEDNGDHIITLTEPDSQTSKPSVIITEDSSTNSAQPKDMVSLLQHRTQSTVPSSTVQNQLTSVQPLLDSISTPLSTNTMFNSGQAHDSANVNSTVESTATAAVLSAGTSISASNAEMPSNCNDSSVTQPSDPIQADTALSNIESESQTKTAEKETEQNRSSQPERLPPPPPAPDKKPDWNDPIELTENMEITVGSKKCVLLTNPDTGQLCAYPWIPFGGKRKRGRPKKEIKVEPVDEFTELKQNEENKENQTEGDTLHRPEKTGESQADAVESLLELSNAGPDGVRRSGRKRVKARTLKDYSITKGSSDEDSLDDSEDEFKMSDFEFSSSDEMIDSDDEEYKPNGPRKKRKPIDYNVHPTLLLGQKRGPGRPRRYPHPGQPANPAQIPAILVNGQTIMIQGLENLTTSTRPLAPLIPKPPAGDTSTPQVITISNGETTAVPEDETQAQESANTVEIPTSVAQTADGQATILQFSEDVVNMLMKKDPVKLGLKAPEADLEKLKCRHCDFQAYYPQQYKEHIVTHTDEILRCKCCTFVSLDETEIVDHYKTSHPRSICTMCNFTAELPYVVKRHMSRHDEKGCTCQICGKIYKDQYIMKMHIKQVHMPADILYECTVCGKKFTRKAHLKRHLRTHEVEKPFKCPHCDYRGCEKSDVAKHMLIHEEPKYVCEICGKAFRHIKNKEVHVKRHSGQKDYKCGICGKYGYTFTDIRKHIERTHSDVKSSMFICEKCGCPFKDSQALGEHLEQGCDQMTIEQALSITTGEAGTGQTIQIPTSVLQADGQPITYDGQHLTIGGNQVNITVQHMNLEPEEESIMLTEEQLAEAQIAVTDGDTQVISTAQMVNDLVEAGLARVTQTVETGQETLDQAVVISAAEAENSIVLA